MGGERRREGQGLMQCCYSQLCSSCEHPLEAVPSTVIKETLKLLAGILSRTRTRGTESPSNTV